ncbi:hypothetical protein FA95DRAFT_1597408 [Auriscalpium vulgare]|uniref:Uncharacterized protein n=1 Tax=Auriscalpium vulgare TaxID=40419 RepID=A0ACB8RL30_9AGAM|nr:hypothetical protein FA95DRAFT_1597408 [Auriscalpium vulgare]
MPKDLPGFYFDHAKNRYFPLSSAPPSRPPPPPPPPRPAPPPPLSLWHSLQQSKSVLSTTQRLSHHHRIIQAQVASTAKCHTTPFPLPVKTTISALSIDWYNDRLSGLAGDVNGILYSMEEPIEGYSDFQAPPTWAQQPSMGSPVSSMSTSGPIRVVTSFGQRSRICVHNLANGVISYLPGQRHMDDIRTSHLRNRGLALGTRRRACHIPDIGHMRGLQCYETGSDVFAVFQEENTLYTGTRNGSVARHDFRKAGSELLLDNVFAKSSNSISYLHVVNDWQLLVSTIRGNIELFDIRYDHGARAVMTIHGQINSYMPHLPHALSPSQDYLFAAGIDNRIRAWSLRTGNALSSQVERVEHEKCINPFTYRFPDTVSALHVANGGDGLYMFTSSEGALYQFVLGGKI